MTEHDLLDRIEAAGAPGRVRPLIGFLLGLAATGLLAVLVAGHFSSTASLA